jgi:hypothetical protein
MTPFGLQKELVDDRRRNLAAQRHGSGWPAVPDVAARHALHEPVRSGPPRMGTPL